MQEEACSDTVAEAGTSKDLNAQLSKVMGMAGLEFNSLKMLNTKRLASIKS